MIERIVIPPYDEYGLSTFVRTDDLVHIGHFGGYCDKKGTVLTTIEEQMEQTLKELDLSLKKIHLTLKNVVKMTVILKNIEDFHGMHSVWMKYFDKDSFPVRTVITSDFVSKDCLVQVEGTACYE
ncbi:RidA family protein [Fusobacteria bacterium ZRK30]|nr:RidA family protein [Fusobacteria bacterium ZRK30]